jgi:hypothetical protein
MKIQITIPETFSEITIEQYQKFLTLVKNNEPSDFVSKKTIEILCNTRQANLLPFYEVESILNQINKIFESTPKFIKSFKDFYFMPNLEDMTFGEFIDLNNYIDKPEEAHKAMAVLYRPLTSKHKELYTIEDYEGSDKYSEQMKQAPLEAYLGAKVFFFNLANELSSITLKSLTEVEAETIRKSFSSLQDGDGINLSMQLLEEMLQNLKVSQN